jgi:hypothetical protein
VSATGRNLVGNERRADDFYSTPAWVTRLIVPILFSHFHDPDVLDPCAGNGAILSVCESNAGRLRGIEINSDRASECNYPCFIGNALGPESWGKPDLIITNPPYSLALPFIERAIAEMAPCGIAAFLTRLNFLGSQKRAAFHKKHPADIYVLSQRPSFTGGGTDATEYCWMVWGTGGGRWSMLG